MKDIRSISIRSFNIIALFTFMICIVLGLYSYSVKRSDSTLIFGVMTVFSIIGAGVLSSLEKLFRMMTRKEYYIITAVLTLGMCGCCIASVLLTELVLKNDLRYVTTAAENFVRGRGIYEGIVDFHQDYFETYPNNHFIAVIMIALYKLEMHFTGEINNIIPTIVNVTALTLSYWLMCLSAADVHDTPHAMVCAARGLLFTPFITYASIFYTDTIPMPLIVGAFFCYLKFRRYRKIPLILAVSIMLGMAYKIKGTAIVLLTAIVIDILFSEIKGKTKAKELSCLLIPFAAVCTVISNICLKILAIPRSVIKEKAFPLIHWVMMGASGTGDYVQEDFLYTQSFPTHKEKVAADLARLGEKLRAMGFSGFLEHLRLKTSFIWDNPTLLAGRYYKDSFKSDNFKMIAFICYFTILLSILFSYIRTVHTPPENARTADGDTLPDTAFIPRLCLFGTFLFLLIWEARCRYLICMFPLFMLI